MSDVMMTARRAKIYTFCAYHVHIFAICTSTNSSTSFLLYTAQFLLCKGADDEEDRGLFDDLLGSVDDAIFGNPMMKSIRNLATRIVTGENGAKVNEKGYAGSLGTSKAWFYSLALEPMEIRSERIVMLAEAYAM